MKKKFSLVVVLMFSMMYCFAQDQIVVDPNAQIRVLNGSFSKIKISNGIDVYLSQSSTESLAVSASEDKYAERILTVIDGNTLRISYDGGGVWNTGNKKLKVYISFKSINELEASGSSDIFVAGTIAAPALKLKLSGSSDFVGNVKTDELVMDLSGSSDVKISGTATKLNVENSGASDVKGYDLAVDICNTKSSGASDINITVNKELNVEASGASDIAYRGTGVVKNFHTSGSSSVTKKDRR